MSFFFPSSPSTSDATSSLTSSPRVGAVDVDELATPTTQVSESPRSPITATSTTRAPGSELLSGSPKAVKLRNSNSNVSDDNGNNGNGNGYYYNDASVVHPLSRQASNVNEHASATHTRRDHDRDDHGHGRLSELGVNLEKSIGRLLRLVVSGESSESGSLSSFDDDDDDNGGSLMGGGSWKGKSRRREREGERAVEDTSSTRIHNMDTRTHRATTTGVQDVASMNWTTVPAAHASTSSALQGTSTSTSRQQQPLMRAADPPVMAIPPSDEEETHVPARARATTHRRRSSHTRSTHSRKHSRRLVVVHKRQEVGVCKFPLLSLF